MSAEPCPRCPFRGCGTLRRTHGSRRVAELIRYMAAHHADAVLAAIAVSENRGAVGSGAIRDLKGAQIGADVIEGDL